MQKSCVFKFKCYVKNIFYFSELIFYIYLFVFLYHSSFIYVYCQTIEYKSMTFLWHKGVDNILAINPNSFNISLYAWRYICLEKCYYSLISALVHICWATTDITLIKNWRLVPYIHHHIVWLGLALCLSTFVWLSNSILCKQRWTLASLRTLPLICGRYTQHQSMCTH